MVRCPKCGSKRVSKFESKWKCDMCRCVFTSSNSSFDDFDVNDAFAQVERLRSERREKERLEQEKLEKARKEKERQQRFAREERERQTKRIRKKEKTAQERVKALNEKRIKEKAKLRRNYTKSAHRKVITAIKEGKTRAEAAELANVSINDINWWYSHGKQGEKPYDSYYKDYINVRKTFKEKNHYKEKSNYKENKILKKERKEAQEWLESVNFERKALEEERLKAERIKVNQYEKERLEMEKRLEKLKTEQEILKKNKLERKKRKRIEREIKGIYIGENLSLLKGCNRRVLGIIYDEINIPSFKLKDEKLRYIAKNYSTKDIKRMIQEANDQINKEERIEKERIERYAREARERKEIEERIEKERIEREASEKKLREEEYNNSVSLLNECSDKVLDGLTLNYLSSDVEERNERIDILAKKFKPNTLKNKIKDIESDIEKKELEKVNSHRWTVIFVFLLLTAFLSFVVILTELGI